MNKRKIIMIVILIAFVAGIGAVIAKINDKSEETSQKVANTQNDKNDIIEITDNYFIEQTNDIFLNLKDYVGKTIKMQGLVYTYVNPDGQTCYAVVRNTPGCCGNDGLAGLDIRYNGEYPKENTWVEIVGVIEKEKIYNENIPAVRITSITETEAGETFVTN